MRSDAHCAQPSMLHFVVQDLRSMAAAESQTGLVSSSSVPSRNLENPIFYGEQKPSSSLVLTFQHLVLSSLKVQVKINNQCVQLQLCCMGFQWEHLAQGREAVLQCTSIKRGHLQLHRVMSFFQIQATESKPVSGTSISRKAPFVQDLSHHSCVIVILWNTMESPPIPSYLNGGPQPANDIQQLNREASMESLY